MNMETPKYSRKTFEETDEQLKTTQDSISGEMSTAELVAAAQQKEGLEQKKTGLYDQAFEMAKEENVERSFAETAKQKAEERRSEQTVSPEQLQVNVALLEENIKKMDQIPGTVLQSKEGQEVTQSFMEKITGKLDGFREGLVNKLATLKSWEGKEKIVLILSGVGSAAILGPVVMQMARSRWPEVGVALDAAPDAFRQFVHLDILSKMVELFAGSDVLNNSSVWRDGGIEVANLLSDISSGRIALASLQPEQLQMLQNGLNVRDFEVITGNMQHAKFLEDGSVAVRTMVNTGLIAGAGMGAYAVMDKIGAMANKYKKKTA